MTDRSDRSTSYVHRALELFAGFGDREALVGGGRRLTYTDVAAEVRATAGALTRHGVRPGDAVLVMLGNPVEGPLLQLALHLLGCRTMWIAPVTSRREVDEFVALARPTPSCTTPAPPTASAGRSPPGCPACRCSASVRAAPGRT